MPRTKLPKGSVPVTFRLAREVQQRLLDKARREEMSFSELIRRALHREIGTARPPGSPQRNTAAHRGRREVDAHTDFSTAKRRRAGQVTGKQFSGA
jgi:hypothetical protein